MVKRDLVIPAVDGFNLAATLFEGGDEFVIVNSATATPRRFYKAFAGFLVENGYSVVAYDYRGIGDSRPQSLRGFEAKMSDWALLDMQGVVEWVSAEFNPPKLIIIGHSIGGQAMGMLSKSAKIDAMITASAQSGYWGLQGGNEKWKVLAIVYTLFPILTHLLGYFPWSKFGSALDIPKGVALEWGRWCRSPGYLLDDDSLPLHRYSDFHAPVLAYSVADDDWGTARSVAAMMGAYPNVTFRHVVPSEHDIESIGHFGLFRPKSKPLWEQMLGWLDEVTDDHKTSLQPAA